MFTDRRGPAVLALDGSPSPGGKTSRVLEAVLAGVGDDCETRLVALADERVDVASAVATADAFVIGSPVYRGSFATPVKAWLDQVPRGMWGETTAPLTARACALVMTGSTFHHYLALDDLRNVLASFFAAHVLTPGLYLPAQGFDDSGALDEGYAERAREQGRALVALARAIAASDALARVRPQA